MRRITINTLSLIERLTIPSVHWSSPLINVNRIYAKAVDRLESQLCDLITQKENQEEIINWVRTAACNIQVS